MRGSCLSTSPNVQRKLSQKNYAPGRNNVLPLKFDSWQKLIERTLGFVKGQELACKCIEMVWHNNSSQGQRLFCIPTLYTVAKPLSVCTLRKKS